MGFLCSNSSSERKCLTDVRLIIIVVVTFLVLEVAKTILHQARRYVGARQRPRALLGCHPLYYFQGDFLLLLKSLIDAVS